MARTGDEVIVHHAGCLHEGVADGGTDEFESAPQQVAAHGIGFGGARRHLRESSPAILLRLSADEVPEIGVEAAKLLAAPRETPARSRSWLRS